MSDQPKKQELPPEPTPELLMDAWRWIQCAVEPERPDYASRRDEVVSMIATAFLAQRQLLAALSDNEAKDARDARIAELEKRCGVFMQGLDAEEKESDALHALLEAAEAKLKSVESIVQGDSGDPWVLLARIREAIK